ncbi:YdeI/OmpD-associated family protein [Pararhodobacter oceanensis]|uniref:YdeI/OmpD-associated family protein n=1 Tax=Pararhodobacter oceanensis TaxID=2172121 RepID=UPI003A8C9E68
MIEDVQRYFIDGCGRCPRFATDACSARRWAKGLAHLRQICRDAGLEESLRWGHPCYRFADRNIALLGAFKSDFCLTLMDAELLDDPDGLLQKPGPNSSVSNVLRFTSKAEVIRLTPAIQGFLNAAKANAEAGRRPEKSAPAPLDLPQELIDALDADPALTEAFHALTPGRQRSYAIVLSTAKTSATRLKRIAKLTPKILSGKGANEY